MSPEDKKAVMDILSRYPPGPDSLVKVLADPEFKQFFPHACIAINFGDGNCADIITTPSTDQWQWEPTEAP